MNDGVFDLFVLKKSNVAEFIRVISDALRGQHVSNKNVFHATASEIKVTTDETMQLNVMVSSGDYYQGILLI